MDHAVKEHPDLVQEYFMQKCVPPHDNKFSALHGAVWSGGSFVYPTIAISTANQMSSATPTPNDAAGASR